MCRYVYGQRAIWTRASGTAGGSHPEKPANTIEVLDFSLAAVLSAKDAEKGKRGTLVAASTIHVGEPPIFRHDVETCLPCVSTVWNLKREYALYMIYADGIVGVDVRSQFSFFASAFLVWPYRSSGWNALYYPRRVYAFPLSADLFT
jgi:hypothetical protein